VGQTISPPLRNKFKHLERDENLLGHFLCKDLAEGDFYIFTKSIAFSNDKSLYNLKLDSLSKLVKLKTDGLVIFDISGHSVTYNQFSDRDRVFETICDAITKCDPNSKITKTASSAIVVRKGDSRGITLRNFLEFW
jgi:hypothetical protein